MSFASSNPICVHGRNILCTRQNVFFILLFFNVFPIFSNTLFKPEELDLSNSAILSMSQDPDGYMWFGTYDGLNLYNGKNTLVYRFEPDNPLSLCSNIIHKITRAEEGYLWVSTYMGLNKFSLNSRSIIESYPQYREARLMTSDALGRTLLINRDGFISYYLPGLQSFTDLSIPELKMGDILATFTDSNEQFCIVSENASLLSLSITNDNLDFAVTKEERFIHNKNITNAFVRKESLFFVDVDGFLYEYNIEKSELCPIKDLTFLMEKYGEIGDILRFGNELFIAFKESGLVKIPECSTDETNHLLMDIGVFCLYKDEKQDILWIGTDGEGVYMYYKKQELFGNMLFDNLPVSIRKPVRSIYTNHEGEVWFGTKGDGIIRIKEYELYDQQPIPAEKVVHYTTENGLSNNQVFCFLQSKYRDLVWIGTQGPGLSYYSIAEDRIVTMHSKGDPQIRLVHSIYEMNDSTLWVATAGDGLLEVIISEKNSQLYIKQGNRYLFESNGTPCNEFYSMIFNEDSLLMIGSRGGYGVIGFNIHTKQYSFLSQLYTGNSAIGDVLSVYKSQNSNYYFGASSGLSKVRFRKDDPPLFWHFDKSNGIVNDMIHGILEDEEQCIWLSTNKSLTKYNPYNDFFHNYNYPDLKITEFSDDAYWKCPYNGKLFFGGVNGFVWVDVSQYVTPDYTPQLRFFEMKTAEGRYSLNQYNRENNPLLKIDPGTSVFTLSFIATDYIEGDNYEYAYQLENYMSGWISLQKNNEVTFTNLPPGKYRLNVKYRNDVFNSHKNYYSLPIYVMPPWYVSSFAIITYILVGIAFLFFILWRIKKRIEERQDQITKNIREEQKEKLYESKLNFFTNITHELCTPLTVINGVNEHIRTYAGEVANEGLIKYTEILSENVKGLNELIGEILDFRKIEESGFTHFTIQEVSVSDLLRKQCESYLPIAADNHIRYLLNIPDMLYWNTDPAYLKKIIFNLISNAFKYTPSRGTIQITMSVENDRLKIHVYNTGEGIEESAIATIFDRYHILENMNENVYTEFTSRNGLGLFICKSLIKALQGEIKVHSKKGEYAEFIATFPLLEVKDPIVIKEEDPIPINELSTHFIRETEEISGEEKPVILVVDDNKDILWLISKELSSSYNIKEANSAQQAFHILEQMIPSLILTDIIMPEMDGLEFITRLKKNKFTKHIPIVVISAKISDRDQAAGINLGADAYLTKPFSPLLLHSVVNRLLHNRKELKNYFYSPESAYDYTEGQIIHQEDRTFLDTITQIIQSNLEKENLRPEFIADEMGVNTRNLYRRVKKISSLSPSDFIKDYRFSQAARLLITTNLNVQEIIYKVGISNKSYFYREFQKKYGMTPGDYRQREE